MPNQSLDLEVKRVLEKQTQPDWERRLLHLANPQILRQHRRIRPRIAYDPSLADAFKFSERIIREHSKSFYLASSLMPKDKRRAIRVLYAFCRVSDDIVDVPGKDQRKRLANWRWRAIGQANTKNDLVARAWQHVRREYRIPTLYAKQLIDGAGKDLSKRRYRNFSELATYAYQVASTVGLMSMHIIGFTGKAAIPYAIKMGVALQITNILRDIAEDWDSGRIYLPGDEMRRYGISESAIAGKQLDNNWREFMEFQIRRNRRLYREAWPGVAMLHPDGRFAVAAAARFYEGILDDIEYHDYDVFHRRAHVSNLGKLSKVPSIWQEIRGMNSV